MKIKINNTELEVFSGARVGDVLQKYSVSLYQSVREGKSMITDRFNNPLDPDGALVENQQLLVIDNPASPPQGVTK